MVNIFCAVSHPKELYEQLHEDDCIYKEVQMMKDAQLKRGENK
ncbi:hypothetical protein [Solibacillus isronensis]